MRIRTWTVGLLVAMAGAVPVQAAPETVRQDWYLRESLRAIRDWEQVLAAWEQATPQEARCPQMPVPRSGESVDYPLPVPATLMPAWDRDVRVAVRLAEGKLLVARGASGGVEALAPDAVVTAYHHPGGGGADRWYHAYQRRFDGMLKFQGRAAPFVLEMASPLDLQRGRNTLRLTLRNVTERPLAVSLGLRLLTPGGPEAGVQRAVTIGAAANETVELPLELKAPGGAVAMLSMEAEGESYWLPLLTDVEDVGAVLRSLEQILTDTPDAAACERLADLKAGAEGWHAEAPEAGVGWRRLFEEASALREELLLRRLDFGAMLFTKREAFDSEQPYMDAHHLLNRPGKGIFRLSPVRPDGGVTTVVDSLGVGIYRDLCLDWDATRLVFSFGNGSDSWDGSQSYHIYETSADGTGTQQLTFGPKNDCEPFFLPNGQTGFTSDRGEHFVMCGGPRHVANLFTMSRDGSGLRQLSYNLFNEFTPSVLPDGRIIYSRWEYNERSVTSLHKPFTIRPDGTMVAPYYGNATIRPNVVMYPRAVPGSSKVMGLFTGHHGQTHGPIGIIDVNRGIDGSEPLTILTPNIPVVGEKAEDSGYGWYSDPQPLSETSYLCSFMPGVVPWAERMWGLYVGDAHGNLALVYRDPEISCAEPMPVVQRPRPHVLPAPAPAPEEVSEPQASLLMVDVMRGLTGVEREAPRYLRLIEDLPRKSVPAGGVILTSGTGMYTVKRIIGTVPVEVDGSASFSVPADRNVYFELLDQDQREIQRMRSVVCLKPGEVRSCIGCHEPRNTAPPAVRASASRRTPSAPTQPPWGNEILSFLRDVQPVLNDRCVQCHTHDREANGVILTDDLTDRFSVAYEELLPYLSVANAMRWDVPEDVEARPAYTYGSRVSPLMKLLDAGHYGVKLTAEEDLRLATWIDANGAYYDRYESAYGDGRSIFSGPVGDTIREISKRRCASCHGESDGTGATWWQSLNRRDVRLSRALQAPLAKAAGGWGRCEEDVFGSTADPDYQALLAALSAIRDQLTVRPREDLLSIRGTPADLQQVLYPAPPPRRAAVSELPSGDWVFLTRLEWESASAGWSPNGDGLPRRDADIEGRPLSLAGRRYTKGIGTHAPSEVVYQLGGEYTRLRALVGAGEAGGTVVFQVWGDERCLFDSGVMGGLHGVKEVDVNLGGVQRLRLMVTDGGDAIANDVASWAMAALLRAPGTVSE